MTARGTSLSSRAGCQDETPGYRCCCDSRIICCNLVIRLTKKKQDIFNNMTENSLTFTVKEMIVVKFLVGMNHCF